MYCWKYLSHICWGKKEKEKRANYYFMGLRKTQETTASVDESIQHGVNSVK